MQFERLAKSLFVALGQTSFHLSQSFAFIAHQQNFKEADSIVTEGTGGRHSAQLSAGGEFTLTETGTLCYTHKHTYIHAHTRTVTGRPWRCTLCGNVL